MIELKKGKSFNEEINQYLFTTNYVKNIAAKKCKSDATRRGK